VVAGKLAADSVLATNLSAGSVVAGKIAAGAVTATEIAAGTITAANIVTGTLTAGLFQVNLFQSDNILTRGLTIRDSTTGAVILASGVPLVAAYADAALKNSSITLNANGTISGAGGGAVTVAGLDNSIVRSANPITAANVSTYIANATIGAAQIGSISANSITTGTLDAARIAAGTITTDKLVVNSVTAANGGGQSSTNYTATGALSVNSGNVSLFTLVTTGAPVIVGGTMRVLVSSILPITTAKSGLIRGNLVVDGTTIDIMGEFRNATYQTSGNGSSMMVTIPISYRITTLAAGSHTFGYLALGGFYDGTGAGQSTNYSMTLVGQMWALENKV
jgi:hypothetical protein